MVLAVGPHTSWKDIILIRCTRNELKIHHAKFIGKKELFEVEPFGLAIPLARRGTPVDRSSKHALRLVRWPPTLPKMKLLFGDLAPEGTRKEWIN
jgi:1-acyl-sn-glycerol-3-phosphate acyltransferase